MSLRNQQRLATESATVVAPELREALTVRLDTIASLKEQRDMLDTLITQEKDALQLVMEEQSLTTIALGAYTARIVRGTTSKLNLLTLYASGVTEAQIQNATEHRPKKPYLDVRAAGKGSEGAGSED